MDKVGLHFGTVDVVKTGKRFSLLDHSWAVFDLSGKYVLVRNILVLIGTGT